jgi:hypothetical protein
MNLSPTSRMSRQGSTTSTSSSSKGGLPTLPDAPSEELPVRQINVHESRQISHSRTSTGDDVTSDVSVQVEGTTDCSELIELNHFYTSSAPHFPCTSEHHSDFQLDTARVEASLQWQHRPSR